MTDKIEAMVGEEPVGNCPMIRAALFALIGPVLIAAAGELCFRPITYRDDHERISSGSSVQDGHFYVLTLFQRIPEVRSDLAADPTFAAILRDKVANANPRDFRTAVNGMIFSESEIDVVRATLVRTFGQSPAIPSLVMNHLRPSGCYIHLASLPDAEMLDEAWLEAARGINQIVGEFALGNGARFRGIGSPSNDLKSLAYQKMILDAEHASVSAAQNTHEALFFEPSLRFALSLMEINHRDELAPSLNLQSSLPLHDNPFETCPHLIGAPRNPPRSSSTFVIF